MLVWSSKELNQVICLFKLFQVPRNYIDNFPNNIPLFFFSLTQVDRKVHCSTPYHQIYFECLIWMHTLTIKTLKKQNKKTWGSRFFFFLCEVTTCIMYLIAISLLCPWVKETIFSICHLTFVGYSILFHYIIQLFSLVTISTTVYIIRLSNSLLSCRNLSKYSFLIDV